jgi:hypothetical protein
VDFLGQITVNCNTIYHKQRKIFKYDPYSYPIYCIYHYPIYWVLLTGNSLCGKNAKARIVTDKETEDFHSELPSRIAVLLAI